MESYITVPTALLLLAGVSLFVIGIATKNIWLEIPKTERAKVKIIGISLFFTGLSCFCGAFYIELIYPIQDALFPRQILLSSEVEILPTRVPEPGFSLPTSSPEITVTPVPGLTQFLQGLFSRNLSETSAEFVASFFDGINSAETRDGINSSWNQLSSGFQNASSNGNRELFLDFWFSVKVRYILQQCSPNTVDVLLTYYNRNDVLWSSPGAQDMIRYTVERGSSGWKIVNGVKLSSTAEFCEGFR